MASNSNIRIYEVEEVFEALTALELSLNDVQDSTGIGFTEAIANITPSPFSTPKQRSSGINRNINNSSVDNMVGNKRPVTPFTTYRLKAISERIRSTNVSISQTGTVCLELFKQKDGRDVLNESFTVSQDGQQITVCQFRNTPEVTNDRSDQVRRRNYHLTNLPTKLMKKYEYCRRFVNLVKSKTPRIIIYNQQAKCMLMENFPDPNYMAKFYNGTTFVSNWNGVKVVNEQSGSILSVTSTSQHQFSPEIQQVIKFSKKCQKQCLEVEGLIKSNTNNPDLESVFPVILGRRKCPSRNQVNNIRQSSSISNLLNTSSSNTTSNSNRLNSTTSNRLTNDVMRQVNIPNIGQITLLISGTVNIEYKDSCHIKLDPTADDFTFIDKNGVCHQYRNNGIMPNTVKCKVEAIPSLLNILNTATDSTNQNVRNPL